MAKDCFNVGILGASGYTGADLVRLLSCHRGVRITALGGHSSVDCDIGELFSHFRVLDLPRLQSISSIDYGSLDVVFCALPHRASQEVISSIPSSVRVIDLSADFRLRDVGVYSEWYGVEHRAIGLQSSAVYGLSEFYRSDISGGRLIACPGCYPTACLLLLVPLLRAGVISYEDLIIDAKSGVSGAGRSLKRGNLFCEVGESMRAYGLGSHRHMPEIEQELSLASGVDVRVSFTPHLVPMSRGEHLTVYARLVGCDVGGVRDVLRDFYAGERFIYVCDDGEVASTGDVRGSNYCHLGVYGDRLDGRVILTGVIDNLVKGSSGQAVQNFNIMFGFDEAEGLGQLPLFP